MGNTNTAEYLIAGLVAMVVVVTFRRRTPKAIELAVWLSLVWVCVLAITNNPNPQARALTGAAAWAASQIVGVIVDLSWHGVLRWIDANRFAIADSVVLLLAIDLFVLALVSTKRQANAWIPVTKLGEWMVLPRLRAAQPEPAVTSAVDEINERLRVWGKAHAAATMTGSTIFVVWLRDVEIPRAARGMENLAFAAGLAWRRVAAGQSQVGEVRISRMAPASTPTAPTARRPKGRVLRAPAPFDPATIDIDQLVNRVKAGKVKAGRRPPATGSGPRATRRRSARISPQTDARIDNNDSEKHRQGRLAS